MRLISFLRRETGLSMTELMVGVGLMGGISVVTMKLMEETAQNKSHMSYTAAVNRAAMIVQNAINNESRCKEMLVGETRDANIYPNIPGTVRICGGQGGACSNSLRIRKGAGYEVLLQTNREYAEGFYIPPYGIQLASSPLGAGVSELVITFRTRSRDASSNSPTVQATAAAGKAGVIVKRIPFLSEFSGGTLRSCGQVVADTDLNARRIMCQSMGGAATWNAGTSTCVLNDMRCPNPDEVPITMTSLGGLVCGPVTQTDFQDQIFNFSSSTCAPGQSVSLGTSVDGKIKAICTGTATGCAGLSTINWTQGQALCSAAITGTTFGSSRTITDSTAPTTGTATFLCQSASRTWVISGTPTCTNSSTSCAPQVVTWSGTTKFCTFTTTATYTQAQKATLTDSTNSGGSDGIGSTDVECSNGKLSVISPTSCN